MAKHIGISTTAIDKNIETLKSKGFLKRIGSDKTGHWEIRVVENRKEDSRCLSAALES
jgi:predicted HTH transcriptional regulator